MQTAKAHVPKTSAVVFERPKPFSAKKLLHCPTACSDAPEHIISATKT